MYRTSIALAALCLSGLQVSATDRPQPEKFSKAEIAGDIFKRPDVVVENHEGRTTKDVFAFLSSDKKLNIGMFQAPANRFEVLDKDYGVDEFMYFVEGGVTLTSVDGTVTEIKAGDAVTIAKEWRGVWESDGYTKIYVIYDIEGEAEEAPQ